MMEVNYVGILLAGIISMVVGFIWYSPVLFAKPWMKVMGYTAASMKEAQKKMGPMYGVSFVLSLVMAYILSQVMILSQNFYHYDSVMTGTTAAFWMWIGFVMPVQATDIIFGGKKWELFYINTGYQLVSLLAMGVILGMI